MVKFQKPVLFRLTLGKEKLEIQLFQLRAITSFRISLLNTKNRKSFIFLYCGLWLEKEQVTMARQSSAMTQRSMNHRPNITSYQVCMEDGGGNGGKSGFRQRTTKYYQFWKFGDGKFKHLDLGTTSANTCFYPWTAVMIG